LQEIVENYTGHLLKAAAHDEFGFATHSLCQILYPDYARCNGDLPTTGNVLLDKVLEDTDVGWLPVTYKVPFDNAPFSASSLLKMKSEGVFTNNRSIWLLHADAHCAFCGGHTEDTSAFAAGYRCCVVCNDNLWPRQISLDAAIIKYYVRPWDVEWPPGGLKLRRGRTVEVSGSRVVISDFVLEEEMELLRDVVHNGRARFWWDKELQLSVKQQSEE